MTQKNKPNKDDFLEAELTEELGYDCYEPECRNSGNNRSGYYTRKMRTSVDQVFPI